MILCISVLSVVISPFSFLILLVGFFSLCFLMSLANGLSIYLLKEPAFSFVDFCYGLLSFFAFISALIFFIISFLRHWGSSFLLFLVVLAVKLDYLFNFPLISRGKLVLLWTFSLALLLLNPIGFGFIFIHFSAYFDFFFLNFFCDLLVIEKRVV